MLCIETDNLSIAFGRQRLWEGLSLRIEQGQRVRLAEGATTVEATRPYLTGALHDAIAPTLATTATMGLVSLPGMMTGVILGGASPMIAIVYQIAIMIAIFSGTAVTILLGIQFCRKAGFTPWGTLNPDIFR